MGIMDGSSGTSTDPTAPNGPNDANGPHMDPSLGVHCAHCDLAIPVGLNRCPQCQRFLPGHTTRRTNPISESRRDEILRQLHREYQPATEAERHQCADLARTLARLEVVQPGKNEHRWLREARDATIKSLNDAREKRIARPSDLQDLGDDELDAHVLARAEELLSQARQHAEARRQRQQEPESAEGNRATMAAGAAEGSGPALAHSPKPAAVTGASAAQAEPEPEIFYYSRRITETDVHDMLRGLADEDAAAIRRESKRRQYERAHAWLQQTGARPW